MPRRSAAIAFAILCIVTCPCLIPARASIMVSQEETHPWTVGTRWSFTWMIDESEVPSELDKRLRFTVLEVRPVVSGSTVERRKLVGNLSRERFFAWEEWTLMKADVPYAEFEIAPEIYTLTIDAIGDNVLVLPMALQNPLLYFKEAYSVRCSPASWDITVNEDSLTYEASNISAPGQRIRAEFNDKGIVKDFLSTRPDGTTKFHMYLESTYDPNSDFATLINVLTISSVGVIVVIVISIFFKKYKIKARDVVKGVRPDDGGILSGPDPRVADGDAF